jgi:hypothetical protein
MARKQPQRMRNTAWNFDARGFRYPHRSNVVGRPFPDIAFSPADPWSVYLIVMRSRCEMTILFGRRSFWKEA